MGGVSTFSTVMPPSKDEFIPLPIVRFAVEASVSNRSGLLGVAGFCSMAGVVFLGTGSGVDLSTGVEEAGGGPPPKDWSLKSLHSILWLVEFPNACFGANMSSLKSISSSSSSKDTFSCFRSCPRASGLPLPANEAFPFEPSQSSSLIFCVFPSAMNFLFISSSCCTIVCDLVTILNIGIFDAFSTLALSGTIASSGYCLALFALAPELSRLLPCCLALLLGWLSSVLAASSGACLLRLSSGCAGEEENRRRCGSCGRG